MLPAKAAGAAGDSDAYDTGHAMDAMSVERWRALCALSMREARQELIGDPWPRDFAQGPRKVEWALHPMMSTMAEFPGHLLMGQLHFANGYSATLVHGCARPALMGDLEAEQWAWPFAMGLAARCGDEATPRLLACFKPGGSHPSLAESLMAFDEDRPEHPVGERSAMFESSDPRRIEEALDLIERLPSAWDEPAQGRLWSLLRSGSPGELSAAIALRQGWAWRKWSKGSRLMALAIRTGRWGSLAEIASRCPREGLEEAAVDCSVALADFCHDWAPLWTVKAAPKALLRAWKAGARIDGPAFVGALCARSGKEGPARAWEAWAEAERAWLESGSGGSGGALAKRL